ncbi:MAG TPA: YbaK/EbsC family protein [Gaiellaceae bacterium]|nr:YbaK/EbsC family protein [Gaiellaceae bacterium]
MPVAEALIAELEAQGIAYEVLEHPRTDRAVDEAAALGLAPQDVAKTIVVSTGERNVRVLLPASERIDMHKLRDVLGAGKELHLLSEDDLGRDYPEFELGAVPPLGGRDDEVLVDRRVAAREEVVFEAGTHTASVKVEAARLTALPRCRVADVCAD